MPDCFIHTVNKLYRYRKLKILLKLILSYRFRFYKSRYLRCSEYPYIFLFKPFCEQRKKASRYASVYEQGLNSIARRCILCFCICYDIQCLFNIRILVYIYVAYSIRMPHNRYLGIVHDVAYKCIRTSRYKQIHAIIAEQKLVYLAVLLRKEQ